jgi:hypothetical protein
MTSDFITAERPWLDPLADVPSPMDLLLTIRAENGRGADNVMRSSVLIAAPTHQAKSVAGAMAAGHDVPVTTIHSAFLQPVFPQAVQDAVADVTEAFRDPALAQNRAAAVANLGRLCGLSPDRLTKELAASGGRVHEAMRGAGVQFMSLASHWTPRSNALQPALAFIDESSMIHPRTVSALSQLCGVVVFTGDGHQLPPVTKGVSAGAQNGMDAALALDGAVGHEFIKNYRLSSEAPALAAVLDMLREAATDAADGNRPLAQAKIELVRELICKAGGGIETKRGLSGADISAIMLGEGFLLTGTNDVRCSDNVRLRAMAGLSRSHLHPGERVIATPTDKAGRTGPVVKFVRANPRLRYVGESAALSSGGDFMRAFANHGQSTFCHDGDPRTTASAFFCLDFAQNEHARANKLPAIGNFRDAAIDIKLGHCTTVHSAQGSQADVVYLRLSCFDRWFKACRGDLLAFSRWAYTALSRARNRVVIFVDLPSAIDAALAEDIRARMAASART